MLDREALFFITHGDGVGVKTQDLILGLGVCAVPISYPSWADNRPRR